MPNSAQEKFDTATAELSELVREEASPDVIAAKQAEKDTYFMEWMGISPEMAAEMKANTGSVDV